MVDYDTLRPRFIPSCVPKIETFHRELKGLDEGHSFFLFFWKMREIIAFCYWVLSRLLCVWFIIYLV